RRIYAGLFTERVICVMMNGGERILRKECDTMKKMIPKEKMSKKNRKKVIKKATKTVKKSYKRRK
ncbi:MAG: hypothetical protein IKZ68_01030, partial [Bacilli bacterium]|nr:hypothetical protein [Bacilli bacterium]